MAQERCATTQVKVRSLSTLENDDEFEKWIREKIDAQKKAGSAARSGATYKIPVVVHVLHNGESDFTNISDAQINSQIAVLNKDFKRQNSDATQTPAMFTPVAGNMDVEFILAKQDPEGLPSTGIVRKRASKSSYTINDNYEIKAQSYWPAEDYLNLWVCNLTGYLGYAQFPDHNLPGLENFPNNRLTDGVVIAYNAFGSIDDGNFNLLTKYNKGRTATHEVAHYFGLKHIWGDDGGQCDNAGDHVDDTPDQDDKTTGCPTHPQSSCSTTKMFQNFMDYTNDACMNLFTMGQVTRMQIILDNGLRRKSLSTSPGLEAPQLPNYDLGIRDITSPLNGACAGILTPVVEVRNYGIQNITSATIDLFQDGSLVETKTFSFNLATGEATEVAFDDLMVSPGEYSFSFAITSINNDNNGPDNKPSNNTRHRTVFVPDVIPAFTKETFSSIPSQWQIFNPDNLETWKLISVPNDEINNKALYMNFYEYPDSQGEVDILYTPVIDISSATSITLTFDIAYNTFENSKDGLKVIVIDNCDLDISKGTVVYEKYGADLRTTTANSNIEFTPGSAADWRTEKVDLCSFKGKSNIKLAFVGVNDYGNNLYLDNVSLISESDVNLTLQKIAKPNLISCEEELTPVILVRNSGSFVSSFSIDYEINNTKSTITVDNISFASCDTRQIELPAIKLALGTNSFSATIKSADGVLDTDLSDNSITVTPYLKTAFEIIPLRQNFETSFENEWVSLNQNSTLQWETTTLDDNKALYLPTKGKKAGLENWFISPVLDLSANGQASMFFDIIAKKNNNAQRDHIKVLASTNCGDSFDVELASYTTDFFDAGTTQAASEWKNLYINLLPVIGYDNVRIAFLVINNNGGGVYLDNIEFFESNSPNPVRVKNGFEVYPNPYYSDQTALYITLNLPDRETVMLEVLNNVGKQIYTTRISNALNQTLNVPFDRHAAGIYFIRVRTSGRSYVSKLIRY